VVGTTTPEFALVGYTTGSTSAIAAAGTPTLVVPTFVGLTGPQFVIVWNTKCLLPPPPPTPVQVTILKYVNGVQADFLSASSSTFQMTSSLGAFTLNPTSAVAYDATTTGLVTGNNYSTNEIIDGSVVGATCSSTVPFTLVGYTSGDTLAAAQAGTPSMTSPAFTNLTSDKYVIVWNNKCSVLGGGIGGTVTGGASSTGVLAVTSIDTVNGTGIADGTFTNGWKYMFHVTAPTNEPNLAMKFADWMSVVGSTTIPVANNMRISSAQAVSTSTVLITAANTYTIPTLNITGDLDAGTIGRQILILVETLIPINTVNGSYTTNYGIKTN
jgi:hypothetical protein